MGLHVQIDLDYYWHNIMQALSQPISNLQYVPIIRTICKEVNTHKCQGTIVVHALLHSVWMRWTSEGNISVLVGTTIKSTETSSWDETRSECMHFNPYFSRVCSIQLNYRDLATVAFYQSLLINTSLCTFNFYLCIAMHNYNYRTIKILILWH